MAENFAYYEILTDSDNIVKDISRLLTLGIESEEIIDSSGKVVKPANPIIDECWQIVYPAVDRTANNIKVDVDDWNNLLPEEYKAVTEEQIKRIGDTVILKTTTIPKDIKANNSTSLGVNSDLNVEKITMYLEIYMPKYLCDSEKDDPFTQRTGTIPNVIDTNDISSGNTVVARNYHHVFMRIFDKLNAEGTGPADNGIDSTTRNITTWNSRTSNWVKLAWYTDFEEKFRADLLGSKTGMLDGTIRVPVLDGLTKDTRVKIWANINRSRVVLGVMGSPNVDFSDNRYLIGCAYVGQIESFDFSINDTAGNFGIFATSSSSPAMGKSITKIRPAKPAIISGTTVTQGTGAVGSGTRLAFATNLSIFNSGTEYNKQVMELTNIPYDYSLPGGGTAWGDRYVDTSTIRVYSTFSAQPDSVRYIDEFNNTIIKSVGVQTSATFIPEVNYQEDDRTKITMTLPVNQLLTSLVGKSVTNKVLSGSRIQLGQLAADGTFTPVTMNLTYNFSYYTEYSEKVPGVIRDGFGNAVAENHDTTYGKNTATGITDFAMYATYTKDYFQKHYLYFASTEQYMEKELYGKSVYTSEYFADKIKVVHSSEGPRGILGGLITIDTSSLNAFDELIINKDFEKYKDEPEETYVFLPITAPYCPFANSPNGRYGIGILKEYIYPVPTTDQEIVDFAIDELEKKYKDLNEVISDFNLLEKSKYGATITWTSSVQTLIDVSKEVGDMIGAKVTRPDFDENIKVNPEVILTATITHGTGAGAFKGEFQKKVIVRMKGMTDSKAVQLDINGIKLPSETKGPKIDLPISGANGSTISWVSKMPDAITNDGLVTRPAVGAGDATVTLTATATKIDPITKKATQLLETFTVTVNQWTLEDEIADARAQITWDLVKGKNTDSQAITDNLNLPTTIGTQGVTAKWSVVDATCVDAATGKVTRPAYTKGQITFTLKCDLSLTGLKDIATITLPVYIVAPLPISDAEAVAAVKGLVEPHLFIGDNKSVNEITTDMTLPNLIDSNVDLVGVTIKWSLVDASGKDVTSSDYIALIPGASVTTAKITRPIYGKENGKITLKATISKNSETSSNPFPLIILSLPQDTKSPTDTTTPTTKS
jgi:hypothetical protein